MQGQGQQPKTERIRGRKGQQIRDRRLKRTNYLCEMCLPKVIRLATVVDHVKPLIQGGADVDENTRNLCDEHNAQATAEQFNFKQIKRIGVDGWPVD